MADYQKGKRGKAKPVIWIGIRISPTGATILYIISILGLISCSFGLVWNVFWYIQYLGLVAAYNAYTAYTSQYMLIYIIFLVALMIFFIYNIRLVRKAQGL